MNDVIRNLLVDEHEKSICLHSENLNELWQDFQSIFKVIHAGGGLVKNQRNEYLFIYRNEKWDLPKGKLERDETIEQCALREVEEECGIHDLTLGEKIKNTYHIYQHKDEKVLKFTHWYKMNYRGNETLIPQLEEGITQVKWVSPTEFDLIRKNTYKNIMEVMNEVEKAN